MLYSGIVAKIRAMQAKALLTDKDFENIANLRSVPEAIDYLKEKPAYAEYMNQMDISCIIEGMWRRCCTSPCMMTIQKDIPLCGDGAEEVLKGVLKRYD